MLEKAKPSAWMVFTKFCTKEGETWLANGACWPDELHSHFISSSYFSTEITGALIILKKKWKKERKKDQTVKSRQRSAILNWFLWCERNHHKTVQFHVILTYLDFNVGSENYEAKISSLFFFRKILNWCGWHLLCSFEYLHNELHMHFISLTVDGRCLVLYWFH